MKPRTQRIYLSAFLLIAFSFFAYSCQRQLHVKHQRDTPISFGIIADCQYCQVEGTGVRKYSQSDSKLTECVTHFNTLDLAYTMHLGDFIDQDWESFDVVNPIYQSLEMPALHVLGNHDFSVADSLKDMVRKKMNMPADYYDFPIDNWRFVALNGNDISFHAYPEDSPNYNLATEYYEKRKIDSPKWNGAIGDEQLKWLEKVLIKASRQREKVALFCHFPVYPENRHN
ncbi:MAG: metallophosphoesterase, partial [Bacteroidia bacterium]